MAGVLLTVPLAVAAPAYADDYPSWQDVQNAQGNEQATQDQITRINDALATAQQKAADASTAAMKAAQAADAARADADAAAHRADELGVQAAAAEQTVQQTHEQVGSLIAARARAETASPLTVRLFTSADPDELLTRLGALQQLDATWAKLGERAIAVQGVATSLQDQAQVPARPGTPSRPLPRTRRRRRKPPPTRKPPPSPICRATSPRCTRSWPP